MPCVSGNYHKGVGAIINVVVIDPRAAPTSSNLNLRFYRGLLDTGATCTCISTRTAKEVGLVADGLKPMASASGITTRKKYLFTLGLPLVEKVDSSGQSASGSIVVPVPEIEGMEFDTGSQTQFDVLVGMDIIGRGSLKIDFDGHFSFCF